MELSQTERRNAERLGVSPTDFAAMKTQRTAEHAPDTKRELTIARGQGLDPAQYRAERDARAAARAAQPRAEVAPRGEMTARERHIAHTLGVSDADFIATRDARRPADPKPVAAAPVMRAPVAPIAPPRAPPPPPPGRHASERLEVPAPRTPVAASPVIAAAAPVIAIEAPTFPKCGRCGVAFHYGNSAMLHDCPKRPG